MITEQLIQLEVEKIKPNPFQPRKKFNEVELNKLANSIKTQGLLSPIIVRKKNNFYEIACGERRLRAVKILKQKTILVIVRRLTDNQMAEIGLTENLQREDINPIEEAEGYLKLKEKFNYTQEQIAEKIGKGRTYIANRLRLLGLDILGKLYVKIGILSSAHGEALLSLKDKNIESNFADLSWDWNISVKELRKMVKYYNNGINPEIKRELPISSIEMSIIGEIWKPENHSNEVKGRIILIKEHNARHSLECFWIGWKNDKPKVQLIFDCADYYAYQQVGIEEVPCIIIFDYLLIISQEKKEGKYKTKTIKMKDLENANSK